MFKLLRIVSEKGFHFFIDFQSFICLALQIFELLLAGCVDYFYKKNIKFRRVFVDEQKALLSRNFDALASLCGSQQMAAGVLSGAHTPLCSNKTVTHVL